MGTKDEIDWDDPEAVAAARGDNPDENTGEADTGDSATDSLADGGSESTEEKKTDDTVSKEDKTETADAATDATAQPDKDKDNKADRMIPKSRLDAKTAQNKALQDRLARYEKQEQEAAASKQTDDARATLETELAAMDASINKAIAEDNIEEANRLRGEQRAKERELWQLDLDETSATTTNETREQVRLDLTIDHIEGTYDEFNPDSEKYSQETVDKVQELRTGFFATGKYTATQALLRAMDYVLPKKDMTEVKGAAEDAGKQADVEAERTKAGLKKATDAANKQPPDTSKLGDDSDKHGLQEEINVDKLSYEDVAALPEATLKRMRGDNG